MDKESAGYFLDNNFPLKSDVLAEVDLILHPEKSLRQSQIALRQEAERMFRVHNFQVDSTECPKEKYFSPEALRQLKKRGCLIFDTERSSIWQRIQRGELIDAPPLTDKIKKALTQISQFRQIAFHPDPKKFVVEGFDKNFYTQVSLSQKIRCEFTLPGLCVVNQGFAIDYVELAENLKKNEMFPVSSEIITRTNTTTFNALDSTKSLCVGSLVGPKKVTIKEYSGSEKSPTLVIILLIFPY